MGKAAMALQQDRKICCVVVVKDTSFEVAAEIGEAVVKGAGLKARIDALAEELRACQDLIIGAAMPHMTKLITGTGHVIYNGQEAKVVAGDTVGIPDEKAAGALKKALDDLFEAYFTEKPTYRVESKVREILKDKKHPNHKVLCKWLDVKAKRAGVTFRRV